MNEPIVNVGARLSAMARSMPDAVVVAAPIVHALRVLLGRRFAGARKKVTVGRRWFWGGTTVDRLRAAPAEDFEPAPTRADAPA